MAYEKVFIRGGATERFFDRGSVLKVAINYDALVEQIKSGELPVSASGNIYFDIMPKKDKPQNEWESTHYLVYSKKVQWSEWSDVPNVQPWLPPSEDDLPF